MTKIYALVIFAFLCTAVSFDKKCIKGDIQYSVADYSEEFKPAYAKLFNRWFHRPLTDFICEQNIRNLPVKDKNKHSTIVPSRHCIIEPLFVDLSSFDGIYGTRIYSLEPQARNPRFTCGYFHYLFILSNNEYTELTSDSLANGQLIQDKLGSRFTEDEIKLMKAYYTDDVICDHLSFLPPAYVKQKDSVLFDDRKSNQTY